MSVLVARLFFRDDRDRLPPATAERLRRLFRAPAIQGVTQLAGHFGARGLLLRVRGERQRGRKHCDTTNNVIINCHTAFACPSNIILLTSTFSFVNGMSFRFVFFFFNVVSYNLFTSRNIESLIEKTESRSPWASHVPALLSNTLISLLRRT